MQLYPILFVTNFIFGCVWMYFQFAFWKALRRENPSLYVEIGGPDNLLLDVSIWKLGKTLAFLLRGKHRRLPVRSLRITGEILLGSAVGFWLTFPLLFIVPPDTWVFR